MAAQVRQLSRLYESAPAYVTDQPPFLNAAAVVDTALPPLDLLRRLKAVEVRRPGCGCAPALEAVPGQQRDQHDGSSVLLPL